MTLQKGRLLFEKQFDLLDHPMRAAVEVLLQVSDYACRQIENLKRLLAEDDCQQPFFAVQYHALAANIDGTSVAQFQSRSRQCRQQQFLRLLLREQGGLASIEETMSSWSDCADALILRTLAFCQQQLSARYGQPCDEHGAPSHLQVLAMGKLGGRELNYSSDIDLIFAYTAAGNTNDESALTNQQFFTKMVQLFIQIMHIINEEGFVFRVDLRLRPNGESGALVSSLAALETYYQDQGRDWERYAMAKARVITAPNELPPAWFKGLIMPFVYRRYVDFSVIESLRSMKALIEREIQLNPMLDDIKRGQGGIREVEFVIQNLQLIRGGRLPVLQCQNAMRALQALGDLGLLLHTSALKEAYLFLRRLENKLQSQNDQQTHTLPADADKQAQIVLAMGFAGWEELHARLKQYQRIISLSFQTALKKVDVYQDEQRVLSHQLANLWQGHVESVMATNLLASLGFSEPERCYQMIYAFRHGPRCRRLSQAARLRLDRFMVLLLHELTAVKETAAVLLKVMQLLDNIVGRSAYLALLTENPTALKELVQWFSDSVFISNLLVSYPFLLEVLLGDERCWHPLGKAALIKQLEDKLSSAGDFEAQEESLRQFKLTHWLLVARAEMRGDVDAVRAGRFLASLAQVLVEKVVDLASDQLSIRHPQMVRIKTHFALIAYGKLGSREMNYNSDLDVVFVHQVPPEEENLVNRLTQKILHMLITRLQSGVLYAVDTRLRPSGAVGLLVSPLSAFLEYQRNQAWIWEHQALIRGRRLYGSRQIHAAFSQLKKDVLETNRDKAVVLEEVLAMRSKMAQHLRQDDTVKHVPGGLLDLEFYVQYLVLSHPTPHLFAYTNTLSLLKQLTKNGVIEEKTFQVLEKAYRDYHYQLHQGVLRGLPVEIDTDPEQIQMLTRH